MAIDAIELIIKIISGGSVGYFTNLLAIKMLFRRGEGFKPSPTSDNLGELIEKKLLTNNAIKTEFEKDEFNLNLEKFINHLIKESIPENTPDKKMTHKGSPGEKEIPGIDKTITNLNDFLLENKSLLEQIDFNSFFKQFNLENIIDNEQVKSFSNKIYDILNMSLVAELKPFLTSLYDELQDKKLTELVSEQILNKLAENFELIPENLHIRMTEFDEEISKIIIELLNIIDLSTILGHLEERIKNKTLLEIIGQENTEKLTVEFIQHFIRFINTDEGKVFLTDLAKALVELAKEIDKPLLNFLNPILQVKMFVFLERNLPYLADTAKEWLRINKQEIDHLIENAIDEYYSTQNIWGQIKLSIKDILGLKISEYFELVEKGIERFENYINNNATVDLTNEVVKFLENKQLGTLITELNLEPEKLSRFFNVLINGYLPKLNTAIFSPLFEKQIGSIAGLFKLDLKTMFSDKINGFLVKQIKYQFFYNPNFTTSLQEIIRNKLAGINKSKISDMLSREKLEEYIGYLPLLLMFSRGKLVGKLTDAIQEQLNDKRLTDFLNDETKEFLKSRLMDTYESQIPKITEHLKNTPLSPTHPQPLSRGVEELGEKAILYPSLFTLVREGLRPSPTHFSLLISKRIIQGIKISFKKLTPEQINDSNRKLIEKNTGTITLIGIIIGGITGTSLYFGQSTDIAFINYTTPLTYALLGIGTNWLALKMLFRPSEQKEFMGLKIPFTPGVSVKSKSKFAKNISNLIDQIFKTKDISENIFTESIINESKSSISEKLNNIVLENKVNINENILPLLVNSTFNKLSSQKEKLASSISSEINNFELKKVKADFFEKYFIDAINKSKSLLNKFLVNKEKSYKLQTLKSLPAKLVNSLNNLASLQIKNKIDEILPLIKGNTLEEKVKDSLQHLDAIIDFDVKLELFMSFDNSNNFKEKAICYLNQQIKDKVQNGIEKFIQHSFMENELAPDKEIRSLFNGDLIPFIKNKMFTAFDSLIFGLGLEKLKDEKENITNRIISELKQSTKDNFLYGLGGSILNIEDDIRNIIHLIIDNKLEPYFKDKKWELENILTGYLDFISRKRLYEIGITEEVLNSENITQVIDKFLNNKNILDGINFLSAALLEDISKYEIGFLLNLIGINSLKDIPGKFTREIDITKEELFNSLIINKEKVADISGKFSIQLLDKFIWSMPFSVILQGISDSDISTSIDNIVNVLYTSETLKTYKKKFANIIYLKISEKKAGEIIDIPILKKSIANTIELAVKDETFKEEITKLIKPLTLKIIENFNIILDSETKNFISNILSQSIFNSLNEKSVELLSSLNINGIVEKEINNLTPEEIETLFNSVSKPQLNKIVLSALIGGIIGILAEII